MTKRDRYIIVKYAADGAWQHYFDNDPKKGAHISHNAVGTYSASCCGVEPIYAHRKEAEAACERLNEFNPIGMYEVCPLI